MKKTLTADFFTANRQRLLASLNGGVVALAAYSEMQKGHDIAHSFEQESNFWYLTGLERPDWWLIGDGARDKWWLVAPEVSDIAAFFDGALSPAQASAISGISEVIDRSEALSLLRQLHRSHSLAYTCDQASYLEQYYTFIPNPAPKQLRELLDRNFNRVQNCRQEVMRLRAIKQPEELKCLKDAVSLTVAAFKTVHESFQSYRGENDVEIEFTAAFRRSGARHAYSPIVAGGHNATTLHYETNNDPFKKRSLVMMDIGAKVENYCADISRTYAYGDPTKRQQQLHTAVKVAQQQIIALCQPGELIEGYVKKADDIMAEALREVGLMQDFDEKQFRRYFPHAMSHGLGIDPHDTLGGYPEFRPGMVLTAEPGIYIPEEDIGVRIEDNIVITNTGNTNLSAKLGWDY